MSFILILQELLLVFAGLLASALPGILGLPAPTAVGHEVLAPVDTVYLLSPEQHPALLLQRAPSDQHDHRRSKRSPFFPRLINNLFPNFIPALDRFEENNRGGFLEDFIDIEREFFNV